MDNIKGVILIGGFIETIELLLNNGYTIMGIVDKDQNNIPIQYRKRFEYLGNDEKVILSIKQKQFSNIPILLSPDLPELREKLFIDYKRAESKHINLISSKANVSCTATIEQSSSIIIQDLVNVSSNVTISRGVHLNTYANVMHDCILEDFVTVAPNAVLLGGVKVERRSYIGAHSTILPRIRIGKNAIVGAGAVVTKDVNEGEIVAGVPAKKITSK
ncbi:MAG: DapH/DapD/GlmU-related protein [Ginsengibacter sp.]